MNLSFYLIADRPVMASEAAYLARVKQLLPYVTRVQYRDLSGDLAQSEATAAKLQALLKDTGIGLDFNTDLEVAKKLGAEGFFIEKGALSSERVREVLGELATIGIPVHTQEDVLEAERRDVDFISVKVNPSLRTNLGGSSHWGMEGLARARALSSLPLVAVGGIHQENVDSVVEAIDVRTDGIAVAGSVWRDGDVELAGKIQALLNARRGKSRCVR